ncbi:MAG: hypothetical protein R2827_02095 [Bdellovibrionales bacterium]
MNLLNAVNIQVNEGVEIIFQQSPAGHATNDLYLDISSCLFHFGGASLTS